MSDRQIIYWGFPDKEHLQFDGKDEAIEAIIDDMYPNPLVGTIEVAGFARVDIRGACDLLQAILDYLEEEFGDPDGDGCIGDGCMNDDPPKAVLDAEKAFIDALTEWYIPWQCEEVCRETVDVAAWVKEYRPDWLTEEKSNAV